MDSECDPTSCVAGSFASLLDDETLSFTTAPDVPFTLIIDGYGDVAGDYNLSVACYECVPEGEEQVVYPGSPSCCPDLTAIPCDYPDTDDTCIPCTGGAICANCWDGTCGLGENICNCPGDCPV